MKLSPQRYERIKQTIAEFFEDYDIGMIPVDVFELAEKMHIKIKYASEIVEKHSNKIEEYLQFTIPNSYLYYDNELQKFIVFIDDVGTKRQRQRFSLAHELAHIILGHTEQSRKNEAEANFGATYILAPTSLSLLQLGNNLLLDELIVAKIFDVSKFEAKIIAQYNLNRVSYFNLDEKEYESTINNLLKDSLEHAIKNINKEVIIENNSY